MQKWYTNIYFLIVFFISATACLMVLLIMMLLPQSPEIIRLMQWRMVRANSFTFDIDAEYAGKTLGDNPIDEKVSLLSHGSYERDADEVRTEHSFGLTVGAGEDRSEYRGVMDQFGNDSYLSFNRLPDHLGALPLQPLINQALRLDMERIRGRFDAPLIGGGRDLSVADQVKLVEQLRVTPFFGLERKLQDDSLTGIGVHHYLIKPEKLLFKDFVLQYETVRLGRELTERERSALDDIFYNIQTDEGELWIGRGDYYLYRMRLRFRYSDAQRAGTLDLTVNFRDFNKPVPAKEKPTGAQDISTFIESLLPGLTEHLPLAKNGLVPREKAPAQTPEAGSKTVDKSADSDNDGLPDLLEHFYGTDGHNPDTDGDGWTDGYEVDHGTNPLGPGMLFDFGLGAKK